ncbi:diphthine--ammonia ligase [Pedobacter changchengzhani]|uniref:Diphthine--ammonia ligase n=1 Tax=Pedobacter changchengzhani TaxID=2529274 RepID=A0A4V2ZZT8_9SPHI|nr:diphthine--ammonia ligase [Pedobacter changchengzhani]TDG34983.1 diphthine--ammonia ligase [Pedobacter changchengzhani]
MKNKKLCIFNWSGGKDSALALYYALQDPTIEIKYLVTTLSAEFNRISMHGVRGELLIAQCESIGIPLYQIKLPELPDMETYDEMMFKHLSKFKEEGITHSIFGDIFLEDLRTYREKQLERVGLTAIFPLWKRNTKSLISEFLKLTFKTIIICTQQNLKSFCGEVITQDLIDQLPSDIDPCGENGEYHSFAFDGPIFKHKIDFEIGEQVFRSFKKPKLAEKDDVNLNNEDSKLGFWFTDLQPMK